VPSYIFLLFKDIIHKCRKKLGIEWCDFVVYSNGIVVVDRILADTDYWKRS